MAYITLKLKGKLTCLELGQNNDVRCMSYYILLLMDLIMMTSSNGTIFRITGPLCGEFTGPGEFPAQRPVTICAWINDWVNNREAGDLRRHRGHYDVNVMIKHSQLQSGALSNRILDLHPANKRRRYFVTASLIR